MFKLVIKKKKTVVMTGYCSQKTSRMRARNFRGQVVTFKLQHTYHVIYVLYVLRTNCGYWLALFEMIGPFYIPVCIVPTCIVVGHYI